MKANEPSDVTERPSQDADRTDIERTEPRLLSRRAPAFALVAGALGAIWQHYLIVYENEFNVLLVFAPLIAIVGLGGVIDPRITVSVLPQGKDLSRSWRFFGWSFIIAGVAVSAAVAFGLYGL